MSKFTNILSEIKNFHSEKRSSLVISAWTSQIFTSCATVSRGSISSERPILEIVEQTPARLGIHSYAIGDVLSQLWGMTRARLGIHWSVPLMQLFARRFVIDLASLRRCDGEGSPCQRWGLGHLVKSKKWFSTTKEFVLVYQELTGEKKMNS